MISFYAWTDTSNHLGEATEIFDNSYKPFLCVSRYMSYKVVDQCNNRMQSRMAKASV